MTTLCNLQNINTKQRGAVLVVSLLVLLVLTLIGISSLDNSVLEEKMASNAQTSSITFQAAESAIRQAVLPERNDPPGAVSDARIGEAAVNRSANGITSSSQLVYDPDVPPTIPDTNGGSSVGKFENRHFQIIGSANVDGISSREIQGFMSTNVMRSQEKQQGSNTVIFQ